MNQYERYGPSVGTIDEIYQSFIKSMLEFKMSINYEQIGKEAVRAGYDGGGIWACCGLLRPGKAWKRPNQSDEALEWLWPDFSYPETEGTALAWIAEKKKFPNCYAIKSYKLWTLIGENEDGSIVSLCIGTSKAEVILAAIKSLGLGKKDNSPTGLNKRLLEVGFNVGYCRWYHGRIDGDFFVDFSLPFFSRAKTDYGWLPDGSHPSTIGVATAWLRSFEKIGNELHFYYSSNTWFAFFSWHPTFIGRCPVKKDGYDSELEALVEFAEWAKEEGLLK